MTDASAGDAATRDGGGRDTGTPDAGLDGGAGGQSMTFRAVQERFFGEPQPPEPNAELILVREDGRRERATADANAEATFDVEPDEIVSVTAFTSGEEHKLASFVGFTRAQLEALDVPELGGVYCEPDPCAELDFRGRCNGDVAEWCEDGIFRTLDCAAREQECGAVDGLGYFCVALDRGE